MCQKPYLFAGSCTGTGSGVPSRERRDAVTGLSDAGGPAAEQGPAQLRDPPGPQCT